MIYKKVGDKEFVAVSRSAKIFNIKRENFIDNLAKHKILVMKEKDKYYIPREIIDKWIQEKEELVNFQDIIYDLIKKTDSNYNCINTTVKHEIVYCKGYNFWGAETYDDLPYIGNAYEYVYVKKDDVPIIEEHLWERFYLFAKDSDVKMHYLLQTEYFKHLCNTKKYIEKVYEYIPEVEKESYVEMTNFLRFTLKKDLKEYSETEIFEYLKIATNELSKVAIKLFTKLYREIQKGEKCNLSTLLSFDNQVAKEERDCSAYELDTFFQIAYMVFNPEHWEKENMIEKAVSNYSLAKTWLNHALHFVCAWRLSDIITKFSRIDLPDEAQVVLEKIRNRKYTESEYKKISYQVEAAINMKAEKPEKTKGHKSSPQMHLSIPESFSSTLGMLFMMCEAHARVRCADCTLNGDFRHEQPYGKNLFGEYYEKVLGGKSFANRKANKAYMKLLSNTNDKTSVDGYLLAAYARSHKINIESIPEVTSRYLKTKTDDYSVNEITKMLFERGTFSFIPYLLCEYLDENFKDKKMDEQTEQMKNIPCTPNEIERILALDEKLEIKVKKQMSEIIKWGNEDNLYEMIKDALESIATGECTSKNEGIYCLRKACKKECCEINRKSCVGCSYEIYTRGFLYELNNEVQKQKELLDEAKTKAEYIKRSAILNDRLYPAIIEVLSIMKYQYGQNIEEFKELLIDIQGEE